VTVVEVEWRNEKGFNERFLMFEELIKIQNVDLADQNKKFERFQIVFSIQK